MYHGNAEAVRWIFITSDLKQKRDICSWHMLVRGFDCRKMCEELQPQTCPNVWDLWLICNLPGPRRMRNLLCPSDFLSPLSSWGRFWVPRPGSRSRYVDSIAVSSVQ